MAMKLNITITEYSKVRAEQVKPKLVILLTELYLRDMGYKLSPVCELSLEQSGIMR